MMFTDHITLTAAFIEGILSFFSPCILPLLPAYFSFITGLSLDELTQKSQADIRIQVILSTVSYVLGFSFVFILMGASAFYLGTLLNIYRDWVRIIGAIIIIIFGCHLCGLFRISTFEFEKRFHFEKKPVRLFGTFVVGMAFAAGWSPCIGPLLGSILILAGNQETVWHAMGLLSIYSSGIAIPFLVLAFFIQSLLMIIKKFTRIIQHLNTAAGIILIGIGILLLTNKITILGTL